MTNDEIRDKFRFEPHRGSFLMAFANALFTADSANFELLKPVAMVLIEKYGLTDYSNGA